MESAVKACVICGEKNSRLSYGARVCESCRVFFIRTTNKGANYSCKLVNRCTISANPRLNCTSCRYQKCIQAGMQPSEVGKKRKQPNYVVVYLNSLRYSQQKAELSLCLLPAGLKNICRLKDATSAYQFAEYSSWSNNITGQSATDFPVNIDISLGDLLTQPTLCSTRQSSSWDFCLSINPNKLYSYKHTYCRVATSLVDMLNGLPEFHKLQIEDKVSNLISTTRKQIKMTQQCYSMNSMLSMYYAVWKQKIVADGQERIKRFDMETKDKIEFGKMLQLIILTLDEQLAPVFSELRISDQEFILLKVISFFTSLINLSEGGCVIVDSTRISYCSLLGKLIEEMHPSLSDGQKISRLSKLLGLIPMIHRLTCLCNSFHSGFIFKNRANLKGTLSYDLHIREF